jgi:MtrB/PioB family decaheme-associated outer membrane protein
MRIKEGMCQGGFTMKLSDSPYKVLLISAGCFLATQLQAQDASDDLTMMEEAEVATPPLYTSEIEIGGGYVSDDSFKFGEYNGLEDEGFFAIANITARKFIPLDSADKTYWELNGRNLGLDSRSVSGEFSNGRQFRLMFDYDQIPHNHLDDGLTPFNGAGTADQTLPAGWVGGESTGALTALFPSLKNFDVETERQRFGGGITWRLTDQWQVSGNYHHEIKDGSDVIGAVFGPEPENARSSILIRPIEYDTDEFNIATSFTGERGQYSLSYHLSLFNNNDNALLWDNPFDNAEWDMGANFSDGARGRLGSEPDNKAFQVTLAGGYNFGQATRATGNISYGKMTQDQTFLPFSSVFPAPIPLPRGDLDGELETVFVNLNLSTRVTSKLGLTARYTYDNRDDNTPRDIYLGIPQDAMPQGDLLEEMARLNRPYSLERHKLETEASYNLMRATRLSLGYDFESVNRDFTEVDSTDEHTGTVRLSFSPFEFASGWLRYQHSARNGSSYVSNKPILTGQNPDRIDFLVANEPDELFSNDPLLRKFHIADRDRDQFAAAMNFFPSDVVTFTVSGRYNADDFKHTQVGLQDSSNGSVSVDAGYSPSKKIGFHAYVTYENYDYKQRGFSHPEDLGALTPATDRIAQFGDNWWSVKSKDNSYSGGAGVEWNIIEDKFNVKADFLASHTVTETTPDSDGLAFLPVPDLNTDIYQFTITGEYKFRDYMGARVRYLYAAFDTSDFARDLVNVDTIENVILLGNGTPNYSDHVIGVSWFYNWQ